MIKNAWKKLISSKLHRNDSINIQEFERIESHLNPPTDHTTMKLDTDRRNDK